MKRFALDLPVSSKAVIASCAAFVGLIGLYIWSTKGTHRKTITRSDVGRAALDNPLSIQARGFADLTADITPNTVVYPDDPTFSAKEIASIGESSSYKLHQLSLCNHTGTHIDYPAHVKPDGKTSSDFPLEYLIREGIIVEVPQSAQTINADFVRALNFEGSDCVFFKTSNAEISKQKPFTDKYVFIEPQAAEALLAMRVKIVGIDYISVDSPHDETLPVHQILLGNNVLIVENLELKGIAPGRCQIYIIPPKIPDMDGLPARVMLTRT